MNKTILDLCLNSTCCFFDNCVIFEGPAALFVSTKLKSLTLTGYGSVDIECRGIDPGSDGARFTVDEKDVLIEEDTTFEQLSSEDMFRLFDDGMTMCATSIMAAKRFVLMYIDWKLDTLYETRNKWNDK